MGTAADKLNYLLATKEEIRTAIIGRGVAVPDGTTFRQYASLIGSIAGAGENGGVVLPDTPEGTPGATIIPNTPENTVNPSTPDVPATPYDPDKPEEMEVPKNIIEKETGQSADTFDVMILQNGTGDVTYGFLNKDQPTGAFNYSGEALPPLPDWDKTKYPYAVICKDPDGWTGKAAEYHLWFLSSDEVVVVDNDYYPQYSSEPKCIVAKQYMEVEAARYIYSPSYTQWELKYADTHLPDSTGYVPNTNPVWANFSLYNADSTLYLPASEPTLYTGFEITWYDAATTNFKAKGWRRLSYHRQGDYWQSDDFSAVESGGWNYLKHITECTREALYYNGVQIWPDDGVLAFASASPFTISTGNNTVNWDGTLEYSTNRKDWTVWDGTAISSSSNSGTYALYFRGTGNKGITGGTTDGRWVISGTDVKCIGNILCLLDYATVKAGVQPAMAAYCFYGLFSNNHSLTQAPALPAMTLAEKCYGFMFSGCWGLTQAPALPATTLADGCYMDMFSTCYGLTKPPVLPALTLAQECYKRMFANCSNLTQITALPALTLVHGCYTRMFYKCEKIKLSTSKTGEYTKQYRIPNKGTGNLATGYPPYDYMFSGTGGTYTSDPEINTTYYLSSSNTIV